MIKLAKLLSEKHCYITIMPIEYNMMLIRLEGMFTHFREEFTTTELAFPSEELLIHWIEQKTKHR